MQFSYIGVKEGREMHGMADAIDKYALTRSLKEKGIAVLSATPEADKSKGFIAMLNGKFSTVSFKQKIFFISNLSEMLAAGLSLTRALKVALKQTKNPKLGKVISSITDEIDKGGTFAGALGQFPDIFPNTTVAMVEAGERSGRVPEALAIVALQMMKLYQLRKRIRGALMYPAIVILAMILIAVMMLVYIVPTLAATFKELGAELPLSTGLIIGVSDFIGNHYIIVALLVIIFGLATYFLFKLKEVKRGWSWLVLHLPAIGEIVKQSNSAITSRKLASLLHSGVDIVAALTITSPVLQNPYYIEIIERAIVAGPGGESLSSLFFKKKNEKYYPPFVGEMMSVGEETGKLPDMLIKLAEFYENEVDTVVKDLSTIIEPIIMLIVGTGVGFFAL